VWSAAVLAPAFTAPQQLGDRLARAVGTVITEHQQRMEPESHLVCRCGALLFRMRVEQGRIQIDSQRVTDSDLVIRRLVTGGPPGRLLDSGQHLEQAGLAAAVEADHADPFPLHTVSSIRHGGCDHNARRSVRSGL
jgi:hypothetical protein